MLRAIPPSMAADTVAEIDTSLDALSATHRIAIPLAIESGSRAWGFPSPDSDYDCRFVYVRSIDQYLSPWVPRDVVELPLVGDLDVNGWDLGKALKLMLKGNAVIVEWLHSPIVYRGDADFREALLALTRRHSDRAAIARHYLHLGERQRRLHCADGGEVAIKKLFYALRPAAALRWMLLHPDQPLPPMHFPTLMAQCDPLADCAEIVEDLLAKKAVTRELSTAAVPAAIADFIDSAFNSAAMAFATRGVAVSAEAREEVADFFRTMVERFG